MFNDFPAAQPFTLQWVAGILETILGSMIVVGLLTPWAAFIAAGEMAYAYFFFHIPRGGWMPIENGSEITVALCFGFLYMVARGSGPLSIDAVRKGKKK